MSGSDQESYARNRQRVAELEARSARIRALNDRFRHTLLGGHTMLTLGVRELGTEAVHEIVTSVRNHADFEPGNDPHEEHDFGAFICRGLRLFWKIDYYGKDLESGSPDPSDPAVTARVLTIMLASEY